MTMDQNGIGMSNSLIIVGGKSNAFISYNILKNKYRNIFYYSDREYDEAIFKNFGFELMTNFDEVIEFIRLNNYFIACGGHQHRESFFQMIHSKTRRFPVNVIHSDAVFESNVTMGYGNLVNFGCYINNNTTIGNLNILNTYSVIEHNNHIGDLNHIAPRVTTTGFVNIGNRNEIYTGATIIPFTTLGDNIIIGAGSVVINHNISESGVYVGVPTKKVK